MLEEIPLTRPETPLLDRINSPDDVKRLNQGQLPVLADELRRFLLYSVGQTGGHFGAGLGVVELTIALHYVTMRQAGGLAAFPNRSESPYDCFGTGHSSTSISAALGMLTAARNQNIDRHCVAVIGDGAMTAGLAFEALNHAGHLDDNLLVILNDNNMSISHNVGGLSSYFARIWASKPYNFLRSGSKRVLSRVPPALKAAHRAEEYMKGMVSPGTLFEEIGFNYIGLVDGHDTGELIELLRNIRTLRGPQLLHIVTRKGKGYKPAEEDTFGMHALAKLEPKSRSAPSSTGPASPGYSAVFGQWLCDMAAQDPHIVGITPAMSTGSGMDTFARRFPERFHDVAIAEQHAVTFAAGLACDGMKPVVAIYSTFLQRAYDQFIHDVALQNLDVLFAIDRAGLVGEDGPTHAGSFDLSFMRCVPNLVIMAPSDENETRQMLYTGYRHAGPAAVRYPRGKGPGTTLSEHMEALPIGKGVVRREGKGVAILAFGSMVHPALEAADELDCSVADMRFVKPLDTDMIRNLARQHSLLVTVEENAVAGGAGSAVNEYLMAEDYRVPVLNLGLPDRFLEHGKPAEMLSAVGLDAAGLAASIRERLDHTGPRSGVV